jgi:hypothetical protein
MSPTEQPIAAPDSDPAQAVEPTQTAVSAPPSGVRGWRAQLADHGIGAALAAIYMFWLLRTTRTLGFSRDESFYFDAANRYAQWFELLLKTPREACTRASVDAYWNANHEHPALMKSLFALSNMFLFQRHKVFTDQSDAFRFPGLCMAGLGLWVTYLFGARVHSRACGIAAAVALALMPRIFYHSHLACFDVPVMTMWVLCIYVYHRAHLTRGKGWALALGVVYGLTLETKHNSWMLPPLFLLHTLLVGALNGIRTRGAGTAPKPAAWHTAVPWHLLAMASLGPLIFIGLWPWLWNETEARFREYVGFHVNHDYYNIEFLHRNYFSAPSPKAYVPVMIAATVPTVTLLLFAIGFGQRLRHAVVDVANLAFTRSAVLLARAFSRRAVLLRIGATLRQRAQDGVARIWPEVETTPEPHTTKRASDCGTIWLLFMGLSVPLAPFLLPATPIFGGTKHWFPAYPFLCVLAGIGFAELCRVFVARLAGQRAWGHAAIGGALALVLGAAPLSETIHSHPFGLSAYVPFFGGSRGAASIGLYRQFWGFTTQSLDAYLQRTSKPGERIFIHDTTWGAFSQMQSEGRLPRGLNVVGDIRDADIAMVQHELHMVEADANIMTVFGHPDPDFVLSHDGVPIISVWRRNPTP